MEDFWSLRKFLKGSCTDLLRVTPTSIAGIAAGKAPGTSGKKMKCLASGQELETKCWLFER